MGDERSRELARRALGCGIEEQAAWLQAALRAGRLSPERLAVAAFLGHPAARAVLGDRAPEVVDAAFVPLWIEGLQRAGGKEAVVRAALAAAMHSAAGRPHVQADAALAATRAWLRRPSEEAAQRCDDVAGGTGRLNPVIEAALAAAGCAAVNTVDELVRILGACLDIASWLYGPVMPHDDECEPFRRPLQRVVREALLPWALGAGDPALDGHDR